MRWTHIHTAAAGFAVAFLVAHNGWLYLAGLAFAAATGFTLRDLLDRGRRAAAGVQRLATYKLRTAHASMKAAEARAATAESIRAAKSSRFGEIPF